MKTGRYIFVIIAFVSFAFSAGCSKEKHELKDNIWKVESMKVHADSTLRYYKQDDYRRNSVTLSFPRMGEYGFGVCQGKVRFGNNNSIEFKCTYRFYILDSPFAEECYQLIEEINTYKISKDKLTLTGDNGVVINLIKQQ